MALNVMPLVMQLVDFVPYISFSSKTLLDSLVSKYVLFIVLVNIIRLV